MNRAQRLLAHTAVAAALALAASAAHAIPITFSFTGTVRGTTIFNELGQGTFDPSHDGEAVSGALVLETEGLLRDLSVRNDGTHLSFFTLDSALISTTLSIGGVTYDPGVYARDLGLLSIIDSSGPQPCGPGCSSLTPDQVVAVHGSTNSPGIFDPTLTGVFDTRSLTLGWHDVENNPLGLIDLSNGFEPLDVLNIPITTITGVFTQQVETCLNGLCSFTRTVSTGLQFGSLTVGAASTSVPEPGTLSLFLLGLLGAAATRNSRGRKWRSGRDSNPRPPA